MAPTVDEALAGLGTAAIEKSEFVLYKTIDPESSFDEMMRSGNDLSSVTQHYRSDDDAEKQRIEMLKPGQTMTIFGLSSRLARSGCRGLSQIASGPESAIRQE